MGKGNALMRVTVLCGGSRIFGLEKMALLTAEGLAARGHEISFIISGWNDGVFSTRLAEARLPFESIYLGKVSKSLNPTALAWTADALRHLPGARRRLAEQLKMFQPDAVIIHHRDWIVLTHSILREQNTFFHVHELPKTNRWTQRVHRYVDRALAGYVAVSQHIAERLMELGADPGKVAVVRNGIDVTEPRRTGSHRRDTLVVGIVGQVGAWKGHEDLIEALSLIDRARYPFECVIYGDGDPVYVASLKERVRTLGLERSVRWAGYVRDPRHIYESLDISLIPSRFDDPCPVVAIEASMYGLPVLATRRGGIPEIVVDEETGLLVDAAAPAQLARSLERLLGDAFLRDRLGRAGRMRALNDFTSARMVRQIESLLLSAGRESPASALCQ